MKLRFTQRAIQDIADIADYIHAENPIIAERVRGAILKTLQILTISVGDKRREGVRKIVTRKYRHIVYYAIDDIAEEVAILSVKHPARERDHSDR